VIVAEVIAGTDRGHAESGDWSRRPRVSVVCNGSLWRSLTAIALRRSYFAAGIFNCVAVMTSPFMVPVNSTS
jgi:hypothetical protein